MMPGPRRVVVEAREAERPKRHLDALAKAFDDLDYEVVRWLVPRLNRRHEMKPLPEADMAVLWNGLDVHLPFLESWPKDKPILIGELGWYPQTPTFQLGWGGFNITSHWHPLSLSSPIEGNWGAWPKHKAVLVVLQDDRDRQITHYSDWFGSMEEWLTFLLRVSPRPLAVRRHPRHAPSKAVEAMVGRTDKSYWETSPSMAEALEAHDMVATINSSAAVEALATGRLVYSFGKSVYRHDGVVVQLTDGAADAGLALAEPDLQPVCPGRVGELLNKLLAQQWTAEDLPGRLERLLEEKFK